MWPHSCDARYNPAMEYTLERTLPFDDFVNALTISPDGALLAVATRDKRVPNHVIDLRDGSPRTAPRSQRRGLCFGADGALYAAGVSVERFDLTAARPGHATLKIHGHKKGLTTCLPSPDGRWIAVHAHHETLQLWHLAGAAPALRGSWSALATGRYFFRADSAAFGFVASAYDAGRRHDTLQHVALGADGTCGAPVVTALPEGLSTYDVVLSSPLGLIAIPFPDQDLTRYDWHSLRPHRLGVEAVKASTMRCDLALSPDGTFAVVQPVTPARRPWSLQVVSLSDGTVIARVVLGDVSAAMLALAPGGRRVACVPSDGTREVRVYAPG